MHDQLFVLDGTFERRARVKRRFFSRLFGLMPHSQRDEWAWFPQCSSIQTLTMDEPLDVAFVDGDGVVVRSEAGVAPGKVVSVPGACATVERVSSDDPWFVPGDTATLGKEVVNG